jgi:hypothetical protein
MAIEVKTLLPAQTSIGDADPTVFSYGSQVTGAGYDKNNNGIHTIFFDLSINWKGNIKIQGTLELYPGDGSNGAASDWFDIDLNGNGTFTWGDFNQSTNYSGLSTVVVTGKFVWLRAA